MNEQIKSIVDHAKFLTDDEVEYQSRIHNRTISHDEIADIFNSKFAELIINECIKVAAPCADLDAEYEAWYAIGQHFGVE